MWTLDALVIDYVENDEILMEYLCCEPSSGIPAKLILFRLNRTRGYGASNRNGYCWITMNHAATIGPCGPRPGPPAAGGAAPAGGAGAGPRSGWKRYALCVTGSTAIVFAPANVSTVATVVYLSGES